MSLIRNLLAAAALMAAAATPALAQDTQTEAEPEAGAEGLTVVGSRIVRQDFEAISPVVTVGSEELDLAAYEPALGWRENSQQTANRASAHGSRGASSVRVIRACEISLRLGDEDCAGN